MGKHNLEPENVPSEEQKTHDWTEEEMDEAEPYPLPEIDDYEDEDKTLS